MKAVSEMPEADGVEIIPRAPCRSQRDPSAFQRAIAALTKLPPWEAEAQEFFPVGAKAASSGAGRLVRLATALAALPQDDADLIIQTLAQTMRPMTPKELEKAFMVTNLSFNARKRAVAALRPFSILMVVPNAR